MLAIVCAAEPAATVIPLPAVLPLALLASIVKLLPEIVTGLAAPVPAPVKFRLLMAKSWPSELLRFIAPLVTVKKTLVGEPGTWVVSVSPAAVVNQFVAEPFTVRHVPLWLPFQ